MFFRINKESIPLKLTMTSSLWLRSLSAFLFFPQLKALDTELWFKLASSISSSLSLFFPLIELLCSGKSVVCLYFIFLLAHLLSIVLFFFSFPLKIQPRKEQTRQHFFLPVTCVRSIHWSNLCDPGTVTEAIHFMDTHLPTPQNLCPLRLESGACESEKARETAKRPASRLLGHVAKHLFIGVAIWLCSL